MGEMKAALGFRTDGSLEFLVQVENSAATRATDDIVGSYEQRVNVFYRKVHVAPATGVVHVAAVCFDYLCKGVVVIMFCKAIERGQCFIGDLTDGDFTVPAEGVDLVADLGVSRF